MAWTNYHSHSHFCDGKADPESFIEAAIKCRFIAYGFSSHAPVPFSTRWSMKAENLDVYLTEIKRLKNKYKGQIEIYTGLETDYIEEKWNQHISGIRNRQLDYTIGSVHYIGEFPDGSHFCFDGESEKFFKGIDVIYHNNFKKAIHVFFHTSIHMMETDKPDIIGHMDKIKMHNSVIKYMDEEDPWYQSLADDLLCTIKDSGSIIEVNTRGTYKRIPPVLYPGTSILKKILKLKIPIMLNSDAHHPDDIEKGFSESAKILNEIGFKTLRILINNKWQDCAFNEKGLLL